MATSEQTKPSMLFRIWTKRFPNDYITERYGDDRWRSIIGSAGHFVTALFEGNVAEAFFRADLENLKKLQSIVGMTKAEYLVASGHWDPRAKGERYINPETGEMI